MTDWYAERPEMSITRPFGYLAMDAATTWLR